MAAPDQAAPFADDFSPAAEEDWRAKVEAALKGAPLQKLVGKTYDGFDIQPLYARAGGKPRAFRADWRMGGDRPRRSSRCGRSQRACPDRSRKRRQRPACRLRRFGRGLRFRPEGRRRPRPGAQERASRRRPDESCSTCRRKRGRPRSPPCSIWSPRAAMIRQNSTFPSASTRSAPRVARGEVAGLGGKGPKLAQQAAMLSSKGFAEDLICGRWPRRPCGGRLARAGTGLRAGQRPRRSAGAGSRRRQPRSRAKNDRFPARRRRRRIPDLAKFRALAPPLGGDRARLRPRNPRRSACMAKPPGA